MNLPLEFKEKYEKVLGKEEFEKFLVSFDSPAVSAYRINPLKNCLEFSKKNHDKAIPNSPFGYYGKISGKSAAHVMGLVYSQEPAAQMVGSLADIQPGMKVLDLCAAPGGKSTQLLSRLENQGLLVSNEISDKRSKILVENIESFGARNVVVTKEDSAHLAKVFAGFFDVIVLDAPCSGEGMFRKDPAATQYWDSTYPAKCAELQREIIDNALKMLAPDGELVYSTCTWSKEEDEDNVRYMLDNYPTLELLPMPHENGLSGGIEMPEVVRCWPQNFDGEGQFIAKLRNHAVSADSPLLSAHKATKSKKKNGKNKKTNAISQEQMKLWQEFEKKNLKLTFDSQLMQVFGEHLYLLPAGLPDLSQLKIARDGLYLGEFKKNRFEPSYALGLALHPEEVKQTLDISLEDFNKYVAGETLAVSTDQAGWTQLTLDGNGLGFAKVVSGTVKNYFPKGLRYKN
ncbi:MULTISPECIES: RsmF rRNA methyltransferase first C-terminal domain-containing protein [unclassified Lactococcus]|uniref:RsmF rRNA methyltransferase first C-terminal domain-containing protein n=1 Tax=unclassified Lactococcus TaxID=2643510 RepID=UPI0011C86474|nr:MULTISPECIES: RsmB/NOP family class I SAM-dependent RNA methyltransferase [unclassified Lactococcus]MQW23821.1 methyltransferase domain-containing protein [Lactococcus sp. dk101]TXK37355.1 methyltransferase domain-containing protein [Lactococcus sp. dk310]TXK48666.1 methyltransferase domain-containing protein [Lactococcus sp. dk322]